MRKLILKMSMSLDGFVGGPNGEMDWTLRSRSEDGAAWVLETLQQAGLHAMGSHFYNEVASYWPTSTDPMAAPMNDIPKVVFTRQKSFDLHAGQGGVPAQEPSHGAASWASARIANGDLAEEMQRLKQEPGNYILAQGGADFARSLVELGLLDEYRLVIHPVALGSGLPLFSDLQQPMDLELISTTQFRAGAMAQVYRPVSA
ncbi:dihydrofolate reductase family protein [Arthrobacter sp. A5]|uniref:dihydrofolate reductase family protein n=1 Tax=Arthrobacter sp. A5 TaxID=576926 RepID=UPI003DA914A2